MSASPEAGVDGQRVHSRGKRSTNADTKPRAARLNPDDLADDFRDEVSASAESINSVASDSNESSESSSNAGSDSPDAGSAARDLFEAP